MTKQLSQRPKKQHKGIGRVSRREKGGNREQGTDRLGGKLGDTDI